MEWQAYEWEFSKEVQAQAAAVTRLEQAVLLIGETGTGHEAVAKYVHSHSRRARGPFVAINCGALPDALLAQELVGREKGFDRNAPRASKGMIEHARGGVLFAYTFEPIGPRSDGVLSRLLEKGEYQADGAGQPITADVRMVVATHRELEDAAVRGEISADFCERLRGVEIRLPPLRDRHDEILGIAERYLREVCVLFSRRTTGLAQSAREAILAHNWLGNLHELHTVLESAAFNSDGPEITADDLPIRVAGRSTDG